ncbi:MAG: hypothetical protein ABIZ80_19405, partial [Bryobacteraceae bacterium]
MARTHALAAAAAAEAVDCTGNHWIPEAVLIGGDVASGAHNSLLAFEFVLREVNAPRPDSLKRRLQPVPDHSFGQVFVSAAGQPEHLTIWMPWIAEDCALSHRQEIGLPMRSIVANASIHVPYNRKPQVFTDSPHHTGV